MTKITHQIKIGKLLFSSLTDEESLIAIFESVSTRGEITIAHGGQYYVIEAEKRGDFRRALESYTYIQPDGIGVFLASKILNPSAPFQKIQTGTDFYFKLLTMADNKKMKIFVLGETQSILDEFQQRIYREYPNIAIVGCHHGYFDNTDSRVRRQITAARPDILIVGMGVPKEQLWVSQNIEYLQIPVVISIGAGIRFMAGVVDRAPSIMRRGGLEWLYRLAKEPLRLWRRYIFGIPYFCYIVIKQIYEDRKRCD
jgi:N-acetylglucosaminyldiphosphoundecaprenol N-acetyl-beta-D-mannosaminyltransferase